VLKTLTFGLVVVLLMGAPASAEPVLLTFEGLRTFEPVAGFYDGGRGGNFGVAFSPLAIGLVDDDDAPDGEGGGSFANEPSPRTVLFFNGFQAPNAPFVNVRGGFDAFSFFYSQPAAEGTVFSRFEVAAFDGLNGSGRRLGRWTLDHSNPFAPGDPTGGVFGEFLAIDRVLDGTARSLVFRDAARHYVGAAFDNLRFDLAGAAPVPEPSSLVLLAGAIAGIARRACTRRGTTRVRA